MVLGNWICKRFLSFNIIFTVLLQSWQYYIVLGLRVYVEFHKFWDFLWPLGIFKAKQAICLCTCWTSSLEFNSVEVVNDFSNWFSSWQGNFLQKSVKSIVKHSCYCHWIALQNFAFVIPCTLFKVSCVTLLFHDYLYDFRPSKKQMKRNIFFLEFQTDVSMQRHLFVQLANKVVFLWQILKI